MTAPQKIKLLRTRLIGSHVYSKGDVVEVHGDRARDMIKHGVGVVAGPDEPITPAGVQRLRSEVIAEQALAQAPARAERAAKKPVPALA